MRAGLVSILLTSCAVVPAGTLDDVLDPDGDGSTGGVDCANYDVDIGTTVPEDRSNRLDENCDGVIEIDLDGLEATLDLDVDGRSSCPGGVLLAMPDVDPPFMVVGTSRDATPDVQFGAAVALDPLAKVFRLKGEGVEGFGASLTVMSVTSGLALFFGAPDDGAGTAWYVAPSKWVGTLAELDISKTDIGQIDPPVTDVDEFGFALGTLPGDDVSPFFLLTGGTMTSGLRRFDVWRPEPPSTASGILVSEIDDGAIGLFRADAGDDDIQDFWITQPEADDGRGRISVLRNPFEGAPSGKLAEPDVDLLAQHERSLGEAAVLWDADGNDATPALLALGAPDSDEVAIIDPAAIPSGDGTYGIEDFRVATIRGLGTGGFGATLATLDFDGDGRDELAVGTRGELGDVLSVVVVDVDDVTGEIEASQQQVRAVVDHGAVSSVASVCAPRLAVANAGDLDEDGKEDLAIGAPAMRDGAGVVGLLHGFVPGEDEDSGS